MPAPTELDIDSIAHKLYRYIGQGDYRKVQELLDPISDRATLRSIEDRFISEHTDTDPVNLAITKREEKIALYLVEKAFSVDRLYQWPQQSCDQWCYYEHGPDKCKAEYTAVDHAEKENLYKLTERIKEISRGHRNPGDGLVVQDIQHHMQQNPVEEHRPKYDRPSPVFEMKTKKTAADEAREMFNKYGRTHVDKNGNTLLHLNIRKPQVYIYVFANKGVPVNIQNKDGDTALHLAVKGGLYETVEALVQCSADIALRNFMGQSPIDIAEGPILTMLKKFQPGLLGVVFRGDSRTFEKFRKFWCSTECLPVKPGVVAAVYCGKSQPLDRILKKTWASLVSKVKAEKSLIELAMMKAEEDPQVYNCVRLLDDFKTTSRLYHAVLCEDVDLARHIIEHEKGWNTNIRFMDRTGKTLLSHAIEANNIDLVRLLVDSGDSKVNGIRVRENTLDEDTVPLFHKCLKAGLNPDIPKFLNSRMDPKERAEKDKDGNTAILRAIQEDCSPKLIHWLIDSSGGDCLVERNKDGLTPKELALANKNEAIVKVIDRYIIQKPAYIPKYAAHLCHERDILDVTDETTGKPILEILQDQKMGCSSKWLKFQDVEVNAEKLMSVAANGDKDELEHLYNATYVDRNGYTVLTRAIVFQQLDICKHLCTTRPELKSIPDNLNRYPLQYAYALPEKVSDDYVKLLLEKNPETIEKKVDMKGRYPAEYKACRETVEVQKMLYDAMTLDVYGKRCPPLGPWPEGAMRTPPDRKVIGQA